MCGDGLSHHMVVHINSPGSIELWRICHVPILSLRWYWPCCREFLDFNLSLPQDKVRETADTAVVHINAGLVELRRLFLVEDLIDSIKFAVCLWCLTYVGAIFNGMTLVILGKVFELKKLNSK